MNIPNDIYTQTSRLVYTMFSDIVWSNSVREDLVSDSVLEYVELFVGQGEENATRQLSTVVRNNIADHLRSSRRHCEILVAEVSNKVMDATTPSYNIWELLNDISIYLTCGEVEVVRLRLDGLTQVEVGEQLGITQQAIAKKIKIIRSKLGEYHEEITRY